MVWTDPQTKGAGDGVTFEEYNEQIVDNLLFLYNNVRDYAYMQGNASLDSATLNVSSVSYDRTSALSSGEFTASKDGVYEVRVIVDLIEFNGSPYTGTSTLSIQADTGSGFSDIRTVGSITVGGTTSISNVVVIHPVSLDEGDKLRVYGAKSGANTGMDLTNAQALFLEV